MRPNPRRRPRRARPHARPGTPRGHPTRPTRSARSPSERPPGFVADEAAVSAVVGYILSFGITAGLLLVILTTSSSLLHGQHVDAATIQFTDLAHRVANAAEEAIYVVDANPDADYEKRLPLPPDVRGFEYGVEIGDSDVWVNATNGEIRTHTVIHNPTGRTLTGTLNRHLAALLTYDPVTETIELSGGS